ncbi:MAG: PAS domain-containing protein, partial [Burkholderiaceae bacterium]
EDALRRSELRFRLASSFGQVWDWDLATNRVDFPAELWLALGHPVPAPDETLAALEAIMEPDDLPVWKQRLKDHLARRRPYELEFHARTSSGELRCFETVGQAVWDETGRATYMAGTTFDITERRRLEDALRSSETRMRHLLSSSPAVIYTARPGSDFAATYCSENVETLIGYPAQEFLSEPEFWLDHVHPDDAGALRAHLAPARMPRRQVLEYRFRHRDGRWCWLRDEVLMTLDDAGGEAELIGSWTDITERREAEDEVHRLNAELEDRVLERTAELARSEARYRTIFETAPMAIGEEDWSQVLQRFAALRDQGVTDGPAYFESHPEFVQECMGAVKLLRMNRKMLELHEGHRADVDLTSLASAYGHSNLMPRFIDELGALWAGERIFTCKNALPTLTGRSQSLMLTMSLPSRNGDEDDDGLALVCLVDISEIDRLNVELDASLVRLRRTNRELETFTYSVSHDLKAPLRGIDGYSRLLLRDHEDGLEAEAREFLTNIRHATQQMAQLIDDLLAYSRLERRTLELTPIALHGFIQQQLASNAEEIRVRGIGLKVDVAADLSALGDSHGLAMALRNLVENALKFSRDAADPTIEVGAIESGGMVTLWVGDNGLGFDMKFHDRIFEIFQRLHRSETYPGTGVGLAIVRKAMERMGGRVWAESEPGRGATFFLQLPATA